MHKYIFTIVDDKTNEARRVGCVAQDAHTAYWHVGKRFALTHTLSHKPDGVEAPVLFAGDIDARTQAHYDEARQGG
jgi:hypothetical protein